MSDAPKMKVYLVALAFHPAPLWLCSVNAYSREDAAAIAAVQCMKHHPQAGELALVTVVEVGREWVRGALRVIEGDKPEGAEILSLVPKKQTLGDQIPPQQTTDPDQSGVIQRQPPEPPVAVLRPYYGSWHYPEQFGPPMPPGAA